MTGTKRPHDDETVSQNKRFKSSYHDTFTVLVGQDEAPFTLHKKTASSIPFFQAACSDRWIEGQERVVRLPEQEPQDFEVFVHYLYTGVLDLTPLGDLYVDDGKLFDANPAARLWSLANYIGHTTLCNDLADLLLEVIRSEEKPGLIIQSPAFWKYAPSGSRVRTLVIDFFIFYAKVEQYEGWAGKWSEDALFDFATALIRNRDRSTILPTDQPKCYYHLHKEGESCE